MGRTRIISVKSLTMIAGQNYSGINVEFADLQLYSYYIRTGLNRKYSLSDCSHSIGMYLV